MYIKNLYTIFTIKYKQYNTMKSLTCKCNIICLYTLHFNIWDCILHTSHGFLKSSYLKIHMGLKNFNSELKLTLFYP